MGVGDVFSEYTSSMRYRCVFCFVLRKRRYMSKEHIYPSPSKVISPPPSGVHSLPPFRINPLSSPVLPSIPPSVFSTLANVFRRFALPKVHFLSIPDYSIPIVPSPPPALSWENLPAQPRGEEVANPMVFLVHGKTHICQQQTNRLVP